MASSPSSIADLINAIKSQNPFDRPLVVRSQDIWTKGFPDVPGLNAHASDTVFEAIEKVRTRQRQVVGITITAEKGLGKSHLVSRIRHHLQSDGSALFVYMSECGDLNRIKVEFLRTLAISLKQIGGQGVSQWRELATALHNEAFNQSYTPQHMVHKFAEAFARNNRVAEHMRDRVLAIKPDIENPDIITAIMWTLSSEPSYELFAINWLTGKSLPQSKADSMGLSNPSTQDKEVESFTTARQILDLISDYKPIVICFDELESAGCNDAGFTGQQVVAILAKDLYDKIKRGVLLTTMFPETWNHQIKALPYAESLTDRIGEKVLELTYLNSDDVVALVSQWLKDFYAEEQLIPPHQVYPFNEGNLRELGKEKPIVRKVLKWCAENWIVPTILPPPKHPVEAAYNKELAALESNVDDYMDNKVKLDEALRLSLSTLIGQTIEKLHIEDITEVKARSADKGYIDFRIIGNEDGKIVKIGVAVIQDSSSRFVQAALKRLIDYNKFDLTRGCLVRSKQVSPGAAKAKQYLNELLSPKLEGKWVVLKSQDMKPLLAISLVSNAREDYELNQEQIKDFMMQNRIAFNNDLIKEILSTPSGDIPTEAIDEDS